MFPSEYYDGQAITADYIQGRLIRANMIEADAISAEHITAETIESTHFKMNNRNVYVVNKDHVGIELASYYSEPTMFHVNFSPCTMSVSGWGALSLRM